MIVLRIVLCAQNQRHDCFAIASIRIRFGTILNRNLLFAAQRYRIGIVVDLILRIFRIALILCVKLQHQYRCDTLVFQCFSQFSAVLPDLGGGDVYAAQSTVGDDIDLLLGDIVFIIYVQYRVGDLIVVVLGINLVGFSNITFFSSFQLAVPLLTGSISPTFVSST